MWECRALKQNSEILLSTIREQTREKNPNLRKESSWEENIVRVLQELSTHNKKLWKITDKNQNQPLVWTKKLLIKVSTTGYAGLYFSSESISTGTSKWFLSNTSFTFICPIFLTEFSLMDFDQNYEISHRVHRSLVTITKLEKILEIIKLEFSPSWNGI